MPAENHKSKAAKDENDRRKQDRREEQVSLDEPDRRESERRSGEDRRKTPRN